MLNEIMKSTYDQIIICIARLVDLNQRFFVQIILLASFMQDVHFDQQNHRRDHFIIKANTLYRDDVIIIV
jgi:hypothetical protein